MSKLDEVIRMLRFEHADSSNAEIAKAAGCDEGLVRRARDKHEIIELRFQVMRLEKELAQYRRATLPPRRDRPGREPSQPLFESYLDDLSVPQTAIPGEQP